VHKDHRYFKPSGSFSPIGLATALGIGVVATLVLGLVYGYALAWIPFIYINFFIVAGYGFGVGFILAYAGKLGKIRHFGLMLGLGFLVGLLAEYVGWVAWLHAMSDQELLILDPGELFRGIKLLAASGVWSLSSWTPTGWALYTVWGIEVLMVIGLATVMGGSMASEPFCERCHRWVENKDPQGPFSPECITQELVSDLEDEKYEVLQSLASCAPSDAYVEAELNHCSGCSQLHLMTINLVTIKINDEGKPEKSEQQIVQNLLVTANVHESVKELAARPPGVVAPELPDSEIPS
jgi:hypothetical protein